jgi:hypothetical protein
LDSDDVWLEGKIEAHFSHIQQHNDCLFSFSNALEVDLNLKQIRPQINGNLESPSFEQMLMHQYVVTGSGSSVVVNRIVFSDLGGFDESLEFGEDLDCWLRLATHQIPCEISQNLVKIRNHSTSMSRMKKRGLQRYSNSISFLSQFEKYPIFHLNNARETLLGLLWQDVSKNLFHVKLNFFVFPKFVNWNFPLTYSMIYGDRKGGLFYFVALQRFRQFLKRENG